MDSVYTKPLMIIFLLVLLTTGLFFLQYSSQQQVKEGFVIDDAAINAQKQFTDKQFVKAKVGDASIDLKQKPDSEALKNMTKDIDLFAKRSEPKTEGWYTDLENSEVYKKVKACEAMQLPEDLPEDNVKKRMDCTWMYNPTGKGAATLATINGPVFLLSQQKFPKSNYEVVWSKQEAIKKERIKACALTTKCDLLVPGNHCGFCPELNMAVPTDNNGNSIYNEARCPAQPVMDPKNCRKPRSEGGGGYDTATCDPDENGNLTKSCLIEIARMSGLYDNGTILRALQDTSTPSVGSQQVRDAADVLKVYNYSIPDSILTDGKVTVNTALNTYSSISQAFWQNWGWWNPNRKFNSRVENAAGNLMWGQEFNPCGYDDSSTEEFKLKCLRDLYLSVGCQGRGSDFPNEKNQKSFWGKSWGDVRQGVNDLVNMMTNQSQKFSADEQKDAIRRCIGTHLRRRETTYCNELGVTVLMFYDSPNGTFFGRKIITNMFLLFNNDSKFWDTLDIFTSPLTSGRRIYLVLKTNLNPDSAATLSFNKVSNLQDFLKWNDELKIVKNSTTVSVDPVNGLIVAPNQQNNQRLEVTMIMDPWQYTQKSGFWYMTDTNNNPPPITICRLPIERKNPIMNIVMNYGDVVEATGNVGVQLTNTSIGTLGDQSCTIFNGSTWIRIGNSLRTRAFRSYTMKVWCNELENRDSFFSFYNGKWEQQLEFTWVHIPWGLFAWIPIPWFQWVWHYYPDNWWKSGNRVEMVTGPGNDTLEANVKPNYDGGDSINAQQSGMIKPKTWQHFTWIWNGDFTAVDIYLDGVKQMSGSGNSLAEQITSENYIGRSAIDNDHRLHKGGMQWFRGFDYPLSKEEIQQDMDDDW